MIGYISGTIVEATEKYVTVQAGQVGYEIYCPQTVLAGTIINGRISLWTQLIHREGSIELFGFPDLASRSLFRLLITISGIGPRSALGILDYNSPAELQTAISTGDITYLTKVSGIGKKTAEKILIELRDKLPAMIDNSSDRTSGDLVDALIGLGYSPIQSRDAARHVQGSNDDMQTKLRAALQFLNS